MNRSRAIQKAVKEKLVLLNCSRLAHERAKLEPEYEKSLADEGLRVSLNDPDIKR